MQTTQRKRELSVIERLAERPYTFQLAQVVRLLLRLLRHHGVPQEQAFDHVLRFQNSLRLSFPPSEIEALHSESDDSGADEGNGGGGGDGQSGGAAPGGDGAAAQLLRLLRGQAPGHITLTPAFIGLLGVSGALPTHHTERIATQQQAQQDEGLRAFLDILSNRIVTLHCQAWAKYRMEQQLDTQARDALLPLLRALGGDHSDAPPLPRARSVPSAATARPRASAATIDAAAYYTALLRTRPVSACALARVLSDHFGVPIELEQLVGCWSYLPANRRSVLGKPEARLGYGATLGTRIWRHDLRVRLRIGPLKKQQFGRFLPKGEAAAELVNVLTLFGAPSIQYEVLLILSRPCLRPAMLSTKCPESQCQLGWGTFLANAPANVSKPEVRYLLRSS